MKIYNVIVYSYAVFWLPVYFYRIAGEPMEEEPALWSAKSPTLPPFLIFPVCDIIVYPPPQPQHPQTCLVYCLGGTDSMEYKHRAQNSEQQLHLFFGWTWKGIIDSLNVTTVILTLQ